jgi:outer membrane protein assembly factor BamB
VWGEKLFVTTAVSEGPVEKPSPRSQFGPQNFAVQDTVYRWELHCLDTKTGRLLWKQIAARQKPSIPIHIKNSYATETPLTDGERVYAYFGSAGLYCYDMAGNLRWKKLLGAHPMRNGWGTASSPTLDGDRLFVQYDNEERSFLVALDKKTGAELWRVERDEKSSWATPFVWQNRLRTELVTMGSRVRAHDPATGKLLWELGGMAATVVASPVATDDVL